MHALVFESSPPIITSVFRFNFLAISSPLSYCHSSSSLVRPEPMISNPPVFLYSSMISAVSSMYLCLISPEAVSYTHLSVIGIDGILGMEYNIQEIPFNISLDWKPAFNLIGYTGFWGDEIALSIRFIF